MHGDIPQVLYRAVQIQKSDKRWMECEDVLGRFENRFAISDGCTEFIGSKIWARQLVLSYLSGTNPFYPRVMLKNSKSWMAWMKLMNKSKSNWFYNEKIKTGSAATFLGISILPNFKWRAIGLGDSCLFQFRRRKMLVSWPMTSYSQFNSTPPLVYTNRVPDKYFETQGKLKFGDTFILATDALAKWILSAYSKNKLDDIFNKLINSTSALNIHKAIMQFKRETNSIKIDDDDITALIIRIITKE